MSAGGTLQSAIAAALGTIEELAGVYDGPPARAAFPYVALDATTETDWSHKSGDGREVLVAITLWDDQPVRLHALADEIETKMRSLAPSRPGSADRASRPFTRPRVRRQPRAENRPKRAAEDVAAIGDAAARGTLIGAEAREAITQILDVPLPGGLTET